MTDEIARPIPNYPNTDPNRPEHLVPPGLTPRDYRSIGKANVWTRDILIEINDNFKGGVNVMQLVSVFNITKDDMRMRLMRLKRWECIRRARAGRIVDREKILRELEKLHPTGRIYTNIAWYMITHWGMKCAVRWKQERSKKKDKLEEKLLKRYRSRFKHKGAYKYGRTK